MNITKVKYRANIEAPTDYTGYIINDTIYTGDLNNPNVVEWEAEGNTPEAPFTQEELDKYGNSQLEISLTEAINAIVVDYTINGTVYQFGGSLATQDRIATGITRAKNKDKELNWFTADSQRVKLTSVDLANILDLIDIEQEAILDSVVV